MAIVYRLCAGTRGLRVDQQTALNYKDVIRRRGGVAAKRKRKMDPLKISGVELDDRDPFRATFDVQLSREMTEFERQTLPTW